MEGSKSVIIDDDVLKYMRLAHVRASVKFCKAIHYIPHKRKWNSNEITNITTQAQMFTLNTFLFSKSQ